MKHRMIFGIVMGLLLGIVAEACAGPLTLWFPPEWKTKGAQAKTITETLAKAGDIQIAPRLAASYPEIIKAFNSSEPAALYGGSFVNAIIKARGLGTALVQTINGKENYSGIMVYPKGENAESILKDTPDQIAYAAGASSGESSAKAATNGKAAIATPSHGASCGAVKAGKAKAAFVKNWWWEANKQKFPEFESYKVPGVSEEKNPDNIISVNKSVPQDIIQKLTAAAKQSKTAFGSDDVADFDNAKLDFSINLMKNGGMDPVTYSW